MLDASEAIHRVRKTDTRKGLQADEAVEREVAIEEIDKYELPQPLLKREGSANSANIERAIILIVLRISNNQ